MKGRIFFSALCLIAICEVVIFPKIYMEAFFAGLSLFTSKLLPVLFPFFIFCTILVKAGVLNSVSQRFFASPAKKLGLSQHFPYVFILSVLSGYPMNAKLTKDIFENNLASETECESIAFSTSCSGILFVCCTVGVLMFNSAAVGIILLCCHLFSCLAGYFLHAALLGHKTEKTAEKDADVSQNIGASNFDIISGITESVASALSSILLVGAYVCIFSVAIKMLEVLGLFSTASTIWSGFFQGVFEITTGIATISALQITPLAISIVTALISFGGISINLQSLALLAPCGISKRRYFALKVLQMSCGAVTGGIVGIVLSAIGII